MVDIYADCGLSGTSAKKRDEFQRLLSDCRKGHIDRVLCKSISRFARNSKECLEIIRELKSLGIGVCFEKEGINTATMSGEMLTAIFAAIAQSESESISGNMRWSYLQRMESGQFITCSAPFGYRLAGRDLEICEPEAVLVRDIFRRYLAGDSVEKIAEYMNTLGIPTGEGTPYWQRTSIIYILTNEKYVGNALLQKRYTTEILPYQSKVNHGERPKHLVLGSHPAIVSADVFEKAQTLFQLRSQIAPRRSGVSYPLSHNIVCGNCGSVFKRRVNGGIAYWVCCRHERKKDRCPVIQIAENQFYNALCRLYYSNHS